ncbi:MAG: hypothetical protein JST68_25590 [Bacteroidetes bacterium]|nr:hypothetical protein [Bacteroidota bacterium]
MIRTGCAILYSLLISLVLAPHAHAQTNSPQPTPTDNAILLYTRSNAAEAHLYNGTLYAGYDRQAQGYPFFQSNSALSGSLTYDGVLYPQVPLYYDLEKDIVVIPDKKNSAQIRLLSEKLSSFTVDGHTFIHLLPDSTEKDAPAEGFYELLYKGKATALARHKKQVQSFGKPEDNLTRYQQYDSWYLERDGKYYTIRNQRDLTNTLGKNLKDYLKKNNISFKKNPADALTKAAAFYSQSSN